jgi:hypothetical protein
VPACHRPNGDTAKEGDNLDLIGDGNISVNVVLAGKVLNAANRLGDFRLRRIGPLGIRRPPVQKHPGQPVAGGKAIDCANAMSRS